MLRNRCITPPARPAANSGDAEQLEAEQWKDAFFKPSAAWRHPLVACLPAANQVVWKKELGAEQALASIKVDPTDWRHICLCGAKGSIVVLRLTNMAQNKVGGEGEGQLCNCKAAPGVQHSLRAALWGPRPIEITWCMATETDVYFKSPPAAPDPPSHCAEMPASPWPVALQGAEV